MDEADLYGPDELADRAGVSRRTVRYYVQRGLLPAPMGIGRGAHYTAAHLERLLQIRALQGEGVPLDEIAERLDDRTVAPPGATPSAQSMWTRVQLADGVELHLAGRRLSDEQVRILSELVLRTIGGDGP